MSLKTNKPAETISTPGLKEKVQNFRDRAREILRARMTSDTLQDIFNHKRVKESHNQAVIGATKDLARSQYRLNQLNEADPDFKTKKADAEKELETSQKAMAKAEEYAEVEENRLDDLIAKAEARITSIEAGEIKVSIDEVKILTDKMIETDL